MVIDAAPPARQTDEQLIGRVALGDVRAFEAIYDRHSRLAFATAKRITGRTGDAEEATQDAFVSLWRAAAKFDPARASLRGWLMSIVRNRSIDLVRRGARHADHRDLTEHATEALEAPDHVEEQILVKQDHREARQLVAGLPPKQREVIGLAYVAEQTQSEIAARTGVSIGTVKGRTRLALRKLRHAAHATSADAA